MCAGSKTTDSGYPILDLPANPYWVPEGIHD